MTDRDARADHTWAWIYKKWEGIAYRTKNVIMSVAMADPEIARRWWPVGSGTDLRFERWLDPDSGSWPPDREVIEVGFDHLGRLNRIHRKKVIYVEHGRSHADLIRMLGGDATDKMYPRRTVTPPSQDGNHATTTSTG
jgi:hypothetical protein